MSGVFGGLFESKKPFFNIETKKMVLDLLSTKKIRKKNCGTGLNKFVQRENPPLSYFY